MSFAREVVNGRIEGTMLGCEDHGIMTAYVHIVGAGWGQGFGGYCLDTYDDKRKVRVATAALGHFVARVLEVVGVEKWEELEGKPVRLDREHVKAHRLGHYLEDKWFDPAAEFEAMDCGLYVAKPKAHR